MFLEKFSDYSSLPHSAIIAMERIYKLTETKNCEIKLRWQLLCLRVEYEPVYPHVAEFVTAQGRMKYVRPLYR